LPAQFKMGFMKEENIYIKNGSEVIEGLLSKSSENKVVVICHPHPLMGGSMYNNVVETIQKVFAAEKYTTLRFNFRGVGRSTGVYDEGKGEQEDIYAAGRYMSDAGIANITFAGYSFGAWVGSKVIKNNNSPFTTSLFISPPNNYFDFSFTELNKKIALIICGDRDQFCDVEAIKKSAKKINAKLAIIPEADHFYMGKENELNDILHTHLIS
jgi:uncharacterized protein